MARTLGTLLGVSKQTEMLIMTVLALWANIFDMALFEFGSNLEQVWELKLDLDKFSPSAQNLLKMTLTGVVFVRTFSLHLYIAFLIAMFWPASFGTRPTLMLPWLIVSAIKNIGTGIVTFATGLYACILYGPLRPACLRFFGSQLLDLSPSFYMWIVGISLYRDLRKPKPIDRSSVKLTEEEEMNVALRRRKVKSMIDEDILRKQFESRRKFIGTSAVEVKEIFTPSTFEENMNIKISRSLDSLLDAMTAEAEILETEEFEPLEDGLNLIEKTAKLLGIKTRSDLLFNPVKPQKKQTNITNSILMHESPLKLLTETSLYSPSSKPVRPTKSELKSPKDFLKLQSPSDFMQSVPENELRLAVNNQEQKNPDNSTVTETIFQATTSSINNIKSEDELTAKVSIHDLSKTNEEFYTNKWKEKHNSNDFVFGGVKLSSFKINKNETEIEEIISIDNIFNKRSEELIKQTNYLDEQESHQQQEEENNSLNESIKTITPRCSREMGCQVSTLSKRILEAPAKEVTQKLTKIPAPIPTTPTRSRTIPNKSLSSKQKQNMNQTTPTNLTKRITSTMPSPHSENSYLSIHFQKMEKYELGKTVDNNIGVDKFGSSLPENAMLMNVECDSYGVGDKTKSKWMRRNLENATFKF